MPLHVLEQVVNGPGILGSMSVGGTPPGLGWGPAPENEAALFSCLASASTVAWLSASTRPVPLAHEIRAVHPPESVTR